MAPCWRRKRHKRRLDTVSQLADCKMPDALEAVDDILRGIDAVELTAATAMEALLGSHIALRNQRRLQTAMRCARPRP